MLEAILSNGARKLVLSAALCLIPPPIEAYVVKVNAGNKQVLVEVDEDRKMIHCEAENWFDFKISAMFAFAEHQKNLLEKEANDFDYNAFRLVKDSVSQSRILAKKFNKILSWMDIKDKTPWWSFAFYGLPMKFFALDEAKEVRKEVFDYLKKADSEIASYPLTAYSNMLYLRASIKNASTFLKEINSEVQIEFPFTLEELAGIEKGIRSGINEADGDKLEKIASKELSKIKKALAESPSGKNYSISMKEAKKTKQDPFTRINKCELVRTAPKEVFHERYSIEMDMNSSMQRLPEAGDLELKIEKVLQKEDAFNLRFSLSTPLGAGAKVEQTNVIDNLHSSFWVLYPSKAALGHVEQSAQRVYMEKSSLKDELKEVLSSKRDSLIIDLAESAFNQSLHMAAEGNVIRIRNILGYVYDKISNEEKGRRDLSKEEFEKKLKEYKAVLIEPEPADKQSRGYIITLPFSRMDNRPIYIFSSLAIRDWYDKARGADAERVIIIGNEDISPKKRFDYKWAITSKWINPLGNSIYEVKTWKDKWVRIEAKGKEVEAYTANLTGGNYTIANEAYFSQMNKEVRNVYAFPIQISTDSRLFIFMSSDSDEGLIEGLYLGESIDLLKGFSKE